MAQYEQVAGLPVGSLVSDADTATVVDPHSTLQDIAGAVANAPGHAVIVRDNDQIASLVTATDIARALHDGTPPATPVSNILGTLEGASPVVLDASVPLARVPGLLGTKSLVCVTDDRGGVHMLKRDELAQRIRDRFV